MPKITPSTPAQPNKEPQYTLSEVCILVQLFAAVEGDSEFTRDSLLLGKNPLHIGKPVLARLEAKGILSQRGIIHRQDEDAVAIYKLTKTGYVQLHSLVNLLEYQLAKPVELDNETEQLDSIELENTLLETLPEVFLDLEEEEPVKFYDKKDYIIDEVLTDYIQETLREEGVLTGDDYLDNSINLLEHLLSYPNTCSIGMAALSREAYKKYGRGAWVMEIQGNTVLRGHVKQADLPTWNGTEILLQNKVLDPTTQEETTAASLLEQLVTSYDPEQEIAVIVCGVDNAKGKMSFGSPHTVPSFEVFCASVVQGQEYPEQLKLFVEAFKEPPEVQPKRKTTLKNPVANPK